MSDENLKSLIIPSYFEKSPPNIFRLCFLLMKYYEAYPYPCIENVNRRTKNIIQVSKIKKKTSNIKLFIPVDFLNIFNIRKLLIVLNVCIFPDDNYTKIMKKIFI